MPDRTDAFVSYSHADEEWLKRIKVHLRPLERDHGVVIWQDTNLRGGQRWRQEIDKALAKAKVAILLISPDFLASDFIHNNELPPLLEAAEKEGLTILSVVVSACAFDHSPLSEFQAINTPDTPLDLLPTGEVNKVLVKLFRRVNELFATPIVPTSKPPSSSDKVVGKSLEKEVVTVTNNRAKLSKPDSVAPPASSIAPLALLVKSDGDWETIAVTSSQIGSGELILTLQPIGPKQRIFLNSLSQLRTLSSIVYNEQSYACQLRDLHSFTEGGNLESWKLIASIKELPQAMDITYNGISPAVQAQSKAQLLLLNERHVDSNSRLAGGFLMSTPINYVSPLFVLYHTLKKDAKIFQQIAPLVATWHLQMTGIVKDILRLDIRVRGINLSIDFEGQRYSQHHAKHDVIKVKGQCEIPDSLPNETLPLRLSKSPNGY